MTARVLPCIAVAALALPAAAGAAPPWSPPADLAGTGSGGQVLVTTTGRAVALSSVQPGAGAPHAASELIPLTPHGEPGTPRGVDLVGLLGATYGRERVVVAGSTPSPAYPNGTDDHSRPGIAFARPDGTTGAVEVLPAETIGQRVFSLAANSRGDVALVTGGLPRYRDQRVRTVWLRRTGTTAFRPALRIRVGSLARSAAVAVGPNGDLLALWEDAHRVYARHLGPTGHAGAIHRLGDGVQTQLQPLIDDTGRLEAAWQSQRVSEGDAGSPALAFFSTAAPGHGFGAARAVSTVPVTGTGRYVSAPGVRLLANGPGRSLLAWTGYDGAHYVVRAADVAGGHRGAPQTLTPGGTDAVLGDLATGPGGAAVVLSRAGVRGADADGHPVVTANVRPGTAAPFGPAEVVSDPAQDAYVPPFAAIDPVSGAKLAVFQRLASRSAQVSARP